MIRLQCVCGRQIAAPEKWLGKRVKCPQCGKPVLVAVPDAPAVEAAAPATSPVHSAQSFVPLGADRGEAAPGVQPGAPQPQVSSTTVEPEIATPAAGPTWPRTARDQPPQASHESAAQTASLPPSKPLLAPRSDAPMEMPPADQEDEDFYLKRARLPRALGILGVLVALGACASCWTPPLDEWTLYIALGGVAISTLGFGLSMSRYRVGLLMPVLGLIASLGAMSFPAVVQKFPRIAPARYLEKADEARRQHEEASDESQRRGLLSVESIQLTGNKDSLAPEVSYKLINRSGKAIKAIEGSIQFADREHRSLGGLALTRVGTFPPNGVIEGTNTWTMEDATQQAIADKKFTAEYRAQTVVYTDGTVKTYSRP